ncbi:(+)-neomenthol dehydrogenase-like [Impatiens glandulifera]|uniref:(+)-neomenthol dehydrogenase-like n=1 Tax=Impatiens glandulifera TaxID=253017 RepID=UPI001FB0A8C0|nr:(+)-neomenthol dehydrogenase-like [Impatiens glandulifera]
MDSKIRSCAIVTGANKGIGFEICKQLGASGITVVLTARDEKRGLEALEKLKESANDKVIDVIFHRLDVADPSTITPLVDFVKAKFGKLDILINNAAIAGARVNWDYLKHFILKPGWMTQAKPTDETSVTYEMAEECLQVNYYGTKRMVEAFVPLLQLSDSPRINIPNKWAKQVLNDADNLTEERIDEVINEFLKDFKEENLESKGWPKIIKAYIVSKAVMGAYTRVLAKRFPHILVNCACPGYVKTDITSHTGLLTAEEGAESLVRLALLPNDGPSGMFFQRTEVSSYDEIELN